MPALPVVSGRECIDILHRHFDCVVVRQRGSHVRVRRVNGNRTTVPLHNELDRGTLRGILRDLDITPVDFARAAL